MGQVIPLVVKPVRRREVVRHYQDVFALSERRACQAMGFGRASHRYTSRRDPAVELRMRLKELAESRVRYGYRRLHILLQREGWQVNHKRLYRLYSEEGLSIRTRSPKRRRACRYRSGRSEADASLNSSTSSALFRLLGLSLEVMNTSAVRAN